MTSYSNYHKSFADELLKKHNLPTGNEEEDKNLKNKRNNLLNQRNTTNSNINNNNNSKNYKNKKHNNPFILNSNNYNFSEF
jgi:hypothetical protein